MPVGFAYMWEFKVTPGSAEHFAQLYGPGGEWMRLFQNAEGNLGTELLRDIHEPSRFVTVDYWMSRAHADRFRADSAAAFEAIDTAGEQLTESERLIGEFHVSSRTRP